MEALPAHAQKCKEATINPAEFPRVEKLRRLLGQDVLLLSWPRGKKGTRRPWGQLTVAAMQSPAYLRRLERGNIGVAQGIVSNGLCSFDFDVELIGQSFLVANPALQGTLRSRGARGFNVWIRCIGKYPRSCKLHTLDDEQVGEWRANGHQTIVSGIHPSGCDYTFDVEASPVEIAFESIAWPEELRALGSKKMPATEHSNSETQSTQGTQGTQGTQVVGGGDEGPFEVGKSVPTGRGQSDKLLFKMARRLKGWEKRRGWPASSTERTDIFDRWWALSKGYVDPSMDYHAYRAKWLAACRDVKFADDEGLLDNAWRAAQEQPMPPETDTPPGREPMSEKMKLLVALCRQLQLVQRDTPFFLGSRDAGRLLGIQHTTAFYWLDALSNPEGELSILKKVSTGSLAKRKANEYLYLALVGGE